MIFHTMILCADVLPTALASLVYLCDFNSKVGAKFSVLFGNIVGGTIPRRNPIESA